MRATEAYDQSSRDLIIQDYAQRFSWYHQVDQTTIEQILGGLVFLIGYNPQKFSH